MNCRCGERIAGPRIARGHQLRLEGARLFDVKLSEVSMFGMLFEAIKRLGDGVDRGVIAPFTSLRNCR
jgi:hypothetical protein